MLQIASSQIGAYRIQKLFYDLSSNDLPAYLTFRELPNGTRQRLSMETVHSFQAAMSRTTGTFYEGCKVSLDG